MKQMAILITACIVLTACGSEKTNRDKQGASKVDQSSHRCANCGMITSNYPNWEEKITFSNGDTLYFDGPRCLFFTLLKPADKTNEPKNILVRDYYTLKYIDGKTAYYVIGSDVTGPMGKELIPFEKKDAAKEFMKDHQGRRIVRFDEVDLELIKKLAGKMNM